MNPPLRSALSAHRGRMRREAVAAAVVLLGLILLAWWLR